MSRADLRPVQILDLIEACSDLIAENLHRSKSETLTVGEQQAIATLWIRLEDVAELEKLVERPTTPLDTLQAEAVELRGLIQQTNAALAKVSADLEALKKAVAS